MLRFMAFCFVAALALLFVGAVEVALVVGAVFVATPFAYIGWHLFFAEHDYSH